MKQKRWFEVPRREGAKVQRGQHLSRPLVERIREFARANAATASARSEGKKKKWFEHPRRSS